MNTNDRELRIKRIKEMIKQSKGVVNQNTCFIQLPNSFVRRGDLTITEKMVYICLWGYGIDLRPSYPSHDKIAKNLNTSRSTIIRAIISLEDKGGLYVLNRALEKNKAKTTNLYYLAEIDSETGSFKSESLDLIKYLYPDKFVLI